jgi:hypothetical protein
MDAAANFGSPSPSLFRHVPPEDGGHYAVALVTGDEPSLLDVSLHDVAIGIGGDGAVNLNRGSVLVGPEVRDREVWLTGADDGLATAAACSVALVRFSSRIDVAVVTWSQRATSPAA